MYRRNVLLILAVFVLVAAVLITCTGCDGDEDSRSPGNAASSAGSQFINTHCPMMPHNAIDPETVTDDCVREYHGQRIAFCCTDCVARWDEIADEEKDQLLSSVEQMADEMREQAQDMAEQASEQMQDMTEQASEQMQDMTENAADQMQDIRSRAAERSSDK
ncbi:MAG: YtxH domain-containing protein [Sedimentisphaerales bacterium]|nr:YtxH domain-containing protein [Sedimentisphaerales bacterium]